MRPDHLTHKQLTFPRIPRAPRVPHVPGEPEGDYGPARKPPPPDWAEAIRECAAVCMAGVAAVLLVG